MMTEPHSQDAVNLVVHTESTYGMEATALRCQAPPLWNHIQVFALQERLSSFFIYLNVPLQMIMFLALSAFYSCRFQGSGLALSFGLGRVLPLIYFLCNKIIVPSIKTCPSYQKYLKKNYLK